MKKQRAICPLPERLERRIERVPESGCWIWMGTTNPAGYGTLFIGLTADGSRHCVRAHRLSYQLHKGEIPSGLFVCHRCDVRPCINPDHLFCGTTQDNTDDRVAKGRNHYNVGDSHPRKKIDAALAGAIISMYRSGITIFNIRKQLGVSKYIVSDICNGRSWTGIER